MAGKRLLDTNIIVALWREDAAVLAHLRETPSILIPTVVVGELCYGARYSTGPADNLQRVEELLQAVHLLTGDAETARQYGDVKAALRLRGRPIPDNDIWIAALARQYDLTLVSRDIHFSEIDDLTAERW